MGHYRSEMGYDEEDRREEERRKARIETSVRLIREAAAEKGGIEYVMAEMLEDLTMAKIRYRR
jgi:hypothetical protein